METQIAKFMGPTWGPPGSCRPHLGPMNLAIREITEKNSNTFLCFLIMIHYTKCCKNINRKSFLLRSALTSSNSVDEDSAWLLNFLASLRSFSTWPVKSSTLSWRKKKTKMMYSIWDVNSMKLPKFCGCHFKNNFVNQTLWHFDSKITLNSLWPRDALDRLRQLLFASWHQLSHY